MRDTQTGKTAQTLLHNIISLAERSRVQTAQKHISDHCKKERDGLIKLLTVFSRLECATMARARQWMP